MFCGVLEHWNKPIISFCKIVLTEAFHAVKANPYLDCLFIFVTAIPGPSRVGESEVVSLSPYGDLVFLRNGG